MNETSPQRPRISVCMATYNGGRYVEEQLASILEQLSADDEIVVVDDASSDDTVARIEALGDQRIRVVSNPHNRGYVKTFERSLSLAQGEVIFLSDQDDLWVEGRVDDMLASLVGHDLVVSNFSSFGVDLPALQKTKLRAEQSNQWRRNILWIWIGTRPYFGCCMAFTARLKQHLLPFPDYLVETHDQWIGYVGNAMHSVRHIEADTVRRRIHDNNVTAKSRRPLGVILRARIMTARAIVEAAARVRSASRATR